MSEKQLDNLRKGREARAARLKKPEVEVATPEPEVEVAPPEPEVAAEPEVKPKKKLTERQLEALRKARESKAKKAVPKKKPPSMVTRRVETTVFDNLRVF